MRRLVGKFFAVNVFQLVLGLATGVIVARALGPEGRGELAAILVPLGVAPTILAFGLTTFAARSAAQNIDIRKLVGTIGTTSLVIGAITVPLGFLVAPGLAQGSDTVETWLVIGFALAPLTLLMAVLADIGLGLEQWRRVAAQRLIPPLTTIIGYVVLLALGELTVSTAAGVTLLGGVLSAIPFLPIFKLGWRPAWDWSVLRRAAGYSVKVSPITFSQILNRRLDQLVMVPLVSRPQLGLYAVAVTVAGVVGVLSSAIRTVLFPKVASGSVLDLATTLRRGMLAVAALALATAAVTPIALPLIFGDAFAAAVPMALILLAASVPASGVGMLAATYSAGEKVGLAGLSEIVSMVVTVIGLILLLPSLEGIGAAIVSFVAYSTNFLWLVIMAKRDFGGRYRDYFMPRRDDFASVMAAIVDSAAVLVRR